MPREGHWPATPLDAIIRGPVVEKQDRGKSHIGHVIDFGRRVDINC